MIQRTKGNYNALSWLQDELQSTLASALNTMNQYIDSPEEKTLLSDCIEAMAQVHGSLEMLNLDGAGMLADEIQQSVTALRDNSAQNQQITEESVVRALLLLPNYLNMLSEVFEDHALILLSNINELREARGIVKLDEISLFQPDFNVPLPDQIAPDPQRNLPKFKIEKNKLAHAYQLHLLNWFKQQDDENLQKVRHIIHFLRESSQEFKTTLLWWAAEVYIDALAEHALEVGNKTKLILGKLIPPIKTHTESGEKNLLLDFPSDLLSLLMLNIAKASSQSANIALMKMTFGLNFFDQRQKIYSMSDNALGHAYIALQEQLQEIKTQVGQYDKSDIRSITVLEQVSQQLQSMSDTLALLEEYESSNLLHTQYEHLDVLLSNKQKPDEETLTELADTLLKVEGLIDASGTQTVDTEFRTVVISECLLEMSNIKEIMTLVSSGKTSAASQFAAIPKQLKQISGSLDMLNYPDAAQILSTTADKISNDVDEKCVFNNHQLSQLADILACCEIFMEGIAQHGQIQHQYLEDAQQKLAQFDSLTEQAVDTNALEPEITDQTDILPKRDETLSSEDLAEQLSAVSSVEQYIQNKTENLATNNTQGNAVSSVEQYVQRLNQPISSVEKYIRQQKQKVSSEQSGDSHADTVTETTFALPDDIDSELLDTYTEEAAELLVSSGNAIKQWQSTNQPTEAVQQLQRDLHTIKGGARLTGISPIAELTHKLETLIQYIEKNPSQKDKNFFDLLQRVHDKLAEMQEQLTARQAINSAQNLIEEITSFTEDTVSSASDIQQKKTIAESPLAPPKPSAATTQMTEQLRVRANVIDDLTNYAGEISISRDRVTRQHYAMQQQLHEMEETVTRLRKQLRRLEIETETQIQFQNEAGSSQQNETLNAVQGRFGLIQQLSRGLSESVIDLLDITQTMESLSRETDTLLLQQSRISTDLQHGLMYTRLLPFSTITPRMERIVRQTANELNKKTELNISGTDIELDRAILDHLIAPIEHILRNAISHGIETTEQRQASGKDEVGHLFLRMAREGSEILLTIEDDGQGINIEKVRQKALSQGLIDKDNIPSDNELVQFILHSGFSTMDDVSQLSGRGVGMDVVNNEIRAVKGRLSINTNPGQGTTFTIRLPLTLSVIQSLLVSVDNEQYALPLASINAGERLQVSDIKTILGAAQAKYSYEGIDYDFIPLATLLDKPLILPKQSDLQLPLLLFRSGNIRLAILVDAVNGSREIVVKPVGTQLSHIRVINGATILGDGRVVFILDIPTLIEIGLAKLTAANNDAEALQHDLDRIQYRPPVALIVDDSVTVRKEVSSLLEREGYTVMTAKDGVDALAQLQNQIPDIILLDVEMPRMDGFDFASVVRNDIKFRQLPIIMITSKTGKKYRKRAMDIGINAYLGKPYQQDALLEHMQQLLGKQFFPRQHK